MADHEVIFLEPNVPEIHDHGDGRMWCQDNVWHESDYDGEMSVKYIRADIHEALEQEVERLRGWQETAIKDYPELAYTWQAGTR